MVKATRHSQWQRSLVVLAQAVVAVIVVTCLYWAQAVFIPVALALLLTFVLSPLVAGLQRRRLRRTPSVLVVVLSAGLLLGGIAWGLGREASGLVGALPAYKENIKSKIASLKEMTHGLVPGDLERAIQDFQNTPTPTQSEAERGSEEQPFGPPAPAPEKPVRAVLEPESSAWLTRVPAVLTPVFGTFGQAVLVLVLVIFMLLHREDLRNRVIRLIGHGRMTGTTRALDEAGQRISRYLLTQFVINAAFGLTLGVGLFFIGVDHPLLWGFLAGALRYVPYLGAWIAALLLGALSLAMFPGWVPALVVLGLIAALELLTSNFLEPWLFGKSLGVSAVALLVAAAFWAFLWGPIGLMLSGPMTVCMLVLGEFVPQLGFLVVLLSDQPALAPDLSYYQRLSAKDLDEATRIVLAHVQQSSPEQVYDALLVPALCYARRDRRQDKLDERDEQFILQATRRIVEELDRQKPAPASATAGHSPNGHEEEQPHRVRILGCPARDETDQVAFRMLQRLLDPQRWELKVASVETLATDLIGHVKEQGQAVVCIGSLPPGGLARCRYLCKRLRAKYPDLRILAGRWGLRHGLEENQNQLRAAGADQVEVSLLATRNHLNAWWPVLAQQRSSNLPNGAALAARERT